MAVVLGLLAAIDAMESSGMVHRDIKPDNIMLSNCEGEITPSDVKLVDFGLATRLDVEPLYGRCGTPGYVAPEIVKADDDSSIPLSSKMDVFSVGVIMYLLLTGQTPFEDADDKMILTKSAICDVDYTC